MLDVFKNAKKLCTAVGYYFASSPTQIWPTFTVVHLNLLEILLPVRVRVMHLQGACRLKKNLMMMMICAPEKFQNQAE